MLLNALCPFSTAKVLALKATLLLLLLQTLVFLAISGGLVVAAGGAALTAMAVEVALAMQQVLPQQA